MTRFMVVDDTRFMRKLLTEILEKLEYEVVGEAENGNTAIQLYRELRPDVVFLDIYMPEMDGIEAMRQIRNIDPGAVIIVCSGTSQQYLISDAMSMGANGYVMKPFKPKQIHEAILKYALPTPVPEPGPAEDPAAEEREEVVPEQIMEEEDFMAEAAWEEMIAQEAAAEESAEGTEEQVNEGEENQMDDLPADIAVNFETADADADDTSAHRYLSADEIAVLLGEETQEAAEPVPVPLPLPSPKPKEDMGLKDFMSSISCQWKETIEEQVIRYSVVCYEGEPYLHLETSSQQGTPTVLSFDGLRSLLQWVDKRVLIS